MKKEYIEPIAKAIELKFTHSLLAGSDPITDVTTNLPEDEQIDVSETPIGEGGFGR